VCEWSVVEFLWALYHDCINLCTKWHGNGITLRCTARTE